MKHTQSEKRRRQAKPGAGEREDEAGVAAIEVKLTHGHLRYAKYPLAVGHYREDVLVSAEAELNASLGNLLRERFDLGRYPGAIGTYAIVRHTVRPRGAIIVGLGDVGELTPARLRETFAIALKEYAIAIAQEPAAPVTTGGYRSAAFSTLLVGTDGGSAGTLDDSIFAILRAAIDTNRALRDTKRPTAGKAGTTLFDVVRIDEVEFVELYEDTATRAAHVIAQLPGILERELKVDREKLIGWQRIATVPGGRYIRPASPYTVGWWQRIGVQQKSGEGDGPGQPDTAAQLKFTVLTDRARLEQDVTTAQRALVTELLGSATSQVQVNHELSATLYQLLVPAPVRDRISQTGDNGNVLFMVDRAGAGFPFELMAARRSDGRLEPLVEKYGILRQFETDQYDSRPEMAGKDRIFVVGNPKTVLLAPLPFADVEARTVRATARRHGLEIFPPVNPLLEDEPPDHSAQQIVTSLMTGEFRIIHIAAHGQYNPDPMKSGVVISDRLFITPADIARLPKVPEFVFLNCCHLGKIGEASATSPDPRLAASLAEGFIRAGVRAIIAAGWSVDDRAAPLFAKAFYEGFLSGATFGEAVRGARQAVLDEYPMVNTWGAYQCYGNPDYRFKPGHAAKGEWRRPRLVTRQEALQALRTLASRARSLDDDADAERLEKEFDDAWSAIQERPVSADEQSWAEDGELLVVAGEIAGELERFDDAITLYQLALNANPASATLVAVEQLANLLCRAAATRTLTRKADATTLQAFRDAEKWLDWLDAGLQPTGERRKLRGSLYKRMAICLQDRRVELLRKAMDCYGFGAGKVAGWGSLNAMALAFALGASKPSILLAEAEHLWESSKQARREQSFWDVVASPDALLLRHVIRRELDASAVRSVLDGYKHAFLMRPSRREWASVTDQIWFLRAVTGDKSLPSFHSATSLALKKLHERLGARQFEEIPG